MDKLKTEYVNIANARIAFRQYGTGTALILLHGNSQNKKIFNRYQTDHFKMFHTIAVDSRGHGESESNDSKYTIELYSDDIIRLCDIKGIRKANVIGYSDGGNIALLLAKKAPNVFNKIVTISPNYLASGLTQNSIKLIRTMVKIFTFLGYFGLKTKKSIMRFMLMLNDIGITENELKAIPTNINIIYAEKDMIKEEHIERIAELVPNSTINRINHCNHFTIFHKKETIATIRRYLLEQRTEPFNNSLE